MALVLLPSLSAGSVFEGRSALDLKDSSWKQRALLLLWRSATSTGPSLEGKDSIASLPAQGLAQSVLRANVCDNSLFWEKSHFDGCLRFRNIISPSLEVVTITVGVAQAPAAPARKLQDKLMHKCSSWNAV